MQEFTCTWDTQFVGCFLCIYVPKHSEIVAYPGDGWQGGRQVRWAGPPAGQRDLEAAAGLAAEGLAWLQRNLVVDSGAGQCDLCLLKV